MMKKFIRILRFRLIELGKLVAKGYGFFIDFIAILQMEEFSRRLILAGLKFSYKYTRKL